MKDPLFVSCKYHEHFCLLLFQFEETILPASMYCLKRAFNNRYGRAMADPVRVSRALSKIVSTKILTFTSCT